MTPSSQKKKEIKKCKKLVKHLENLTTERIFKNVEMRSMIEWNSFHYVKILPFSRYLLRCSISSTNLSIRFSFLARGGEGITFGVIFGREKTKGRKRSLKRGGIRCKYRLSWYRIAVVGGERREWVRSEAEFSSAAADRVCRR